MLVSEVLPNSPWRPMAAIAPPVAERVEYPYPGGEARGLQFQPADGGRYPAIILFLGINPDLQDESLHRLASALARQGVVVLIPSPVELLRGDIAYEEVERLVGAFLYLQGQEYVQPSRIGYAGFSVGASLALIAAADPRVSAHVRFVNFFGGYFTARDLLTAMTLRRLDQDGISEPWEPNYDARIWMSRVLIRSVPEQRGRLLLERLLVDSREPPAEELAALSLQAQAVYQVLANRDPERAQALYEALPGELRAKFERLSPASVLPRLRTKVFIMHDRNDTYIPFVESKRLYAALEQMGYPQKHFTEFDLFQHMHPQRQLPPLEFVREVAKLSYHLYRLLLEIGEQRPA